MIHKDLLFLYYQGFRSMLNCSLNKQDILVSYFQFIDMKVSILLVLALLIYGGIATVQRHLLTPIPSHQLSSQPIHQGITGGGSLGGSIFTGFILGPFLFICAIICIWYNQKRAAIDSRRLKLASSICEDVDVNSQASAMHQNGKLVHASGQTTTNLTIGDPISGVHGPNLIKITRSVQVLQWRRHTRTQGEQTQTYYELQWVSSNSESQGSYHNSPANWFISNDVIYNTQVYLGGYNIDKATADKCQRVIPFQPTMEHGQNIMNNTRRGGTMPNVTTQYIQFAPMESPSDVGGKFMGDGAGSLRVKFMLCPTGDLSLVARSTGATFSPFPIAQYEMTTDQTNTVPDCCCCLVSKCYAKLLQPIETIHLVKEERRSKQQLFTEAIKESECFTRGVRIGCYILMVVSICLLFSPITTLVGYIPFVGGFISGILFFAILLAALIICIPLFLLVMSAAWLRYHPKVGLIILGVGLLIFGVILFISSRG